MPPPPPVAAAGTAAAATAATWISLPWVLTEILPFLDVLTDVSTMVTNASSNTYYIAGMVVFGLHLVARAVGIWSRLSETHDAPLWGFAFLLFVALPLAILLGCLGIVLLFVTAAVDLVASVGAYSVTKKWSRPTHNIVFDRFGHAVGMLLQLHREEEAMGPGYMGKSWRPINIAISGQRGLVGVAGYPWETKGFTLNQLLAEETLENGQFAPSSARRSLTPPTARSHPSPSAVAGLLLSASNINSAWSVASVAVTAVSVLLEIGVQYGYWQKYREEVSSSCSLPSPSPCRRPPRRRARR